MARKPPRRIQQTDHFAMIPVPVLQSAACRGLSAGEWATLLMLAGQYRGRNNGRLDATERTCRQYGLSRRTAQWALPRLTDRGLIRKTRQGGKKPLGPTFWAIAWQPIDAIDGKDLAVPKEAPATWKNYPDGATRCHVPAQPVAPLTPVTVQAVATSAPRNGATRCSPSRTIGASRGAAPAPQEPAATTKAWAKPTWRIIPAGMEG